MKRKLSEDVVYGPPAPIEFSVAQARAALMRHSGQDIVALERVDDGPCDDCHTERPRYRYGRVQVCLTCGLGRRKTVLAA